MYIKSLYTTYTAGRAPNPLLDGFSGTWETGLKDLLPANPKYTKTQIGTVTSGRMFARSLGSLAAAIVKSYPCGKYIIYEP